MRPRDLLFWDSALWGPIQRGCRLVFTAGTFDLIHPGHVKLIERCRKIAGHDGKVIVGVNTDTCLVGRKLVTQDYETRAKMVSAIHGVDRTCPFDTVDSRFILEHEFMVHELGNHHRFWIEPFVVVGSDWASKDYYKLMNFDDGWLDEHRITVLYTQYTTGISSTMLREKLNGENQR